MKRERTNHQGLRTPSGRLRKARIHADWMISDDAQGPNPLMRAGMLSVAPEWRADDALLAVAPQARLRDGLLAIAPLDC